MESNKTQFHSIKTVTRFIILYKRILTMTSCTLYIFIERYFIHIHKFFSTLAWTPPTPKTNLFSQFFFSFYIYTKVISIDIFFGV